MSFFDKAKQAATEMAAKADAAMKDAGISTPGGGGLFGGGGADRALRDLGLLTWREQQGQAVDPADRARVLAAVRDLDAAGQLASLSVTPPAPPAPGGWTAGMPPPPPGAAAAGPAGGGSTPAPPSAEPLDDPRAEPPASGASGGGTTPPPPPPSWA